MEHKEQELFRIIESMRWYLSVSWINNTQVSKTMDKYLDAMEKIIRKEK